MKKIIITLALAGLCFACKSEDDKMAVNDASVPGAVPTAECAEGKACCADKSAECAEMKAACEKSKAECEAKVCPVTGKVIQ